MSDSLFVAIKSVQHDVGLLLLLVIVCFVITMAFIGFCVDLIRARH